MEQLLIALTTLFATINSSLSASSSEEATDNLVLEAHQPLITQSRFEEKLATISATIPKQTTYQDDPERELGEEQVLAEGEDGQKITTYKITFYKHASTLDGGPEGDSSEVRQTGEEFSREIVNIQTIEPNKRVVARGTKVVWKILDTPDGTISYWKKLRVWATHYDSKCPGCNEWTATGMRAGKGVIAVDPKVIKLGSKVYIPGYGFAVAGDTGGSIRGNIIDLGFDDARTSGWRAKFVDIYLL